MARFQQMTTETEEVANLTMDGEKPLCLEVAPFLTTGNEFVDRALGMNPTQRVEKTGDLELAGIVTHDHQRRVNALSDQAAD